MQAAQGACCAPGHPKPLSPKAEPGSRAAGPPPWGPCRHLQGQNPERVLHPYLQQQTGCHKHNLFLLVLASCLQWGLILQREVDSLFSECRCVCGSHLTTSPHPSLSSSLHPITSSEYPHISASPQPLCPEHGTLEHPSPTTSAHAGTSPSRLSSRPSPQWVTQEDSFNHFCPWNSTVIIARVALMSSFLYLFFLSKGLKLVTKLTDYLEYSKAEYSVCFSFYLGRGHGNTLLILEIKLFWNIRIHEVMLRICFWIMSGLGPRASPTTGECPYPLNANIITSAGSIYPAWVKL